MLFSRKKKRKAKKKPKKTARKKAAVKKLKKRAVKRAKTGRPKRRKAAVKRPPKISRGEEAQVGTVSHYFPHVKAGAIVIEGGTLAVGDTIHIKGHTTDFKQKISSMQVDHKEVSEAKAGQEIGLKTDEKAREHDKVYKL